MPSAMSQMERTMAWPHLDVESKKARLQLAQWSPGAGRRRTVTTEYTGPALGRIGSGGLVCCVVPLRASEGAAFKCSDRHPRDKGVCEAEGVPTGLAGTCVSWSKPPLPQLHTEGNETSFHRNIRARETIAIQTTKMLAASGFPRTLGEPSPLPPPRLQQALIYFLSPKIH